MKAPVLLAATPVALWALLASLAAQEQPVVPNNTDNLGRLRVIRRQFLIGPMSEVARDPRWGRVAETCGEDPYLAARCVDASVRGFQGTNPAATDRVAACLKHYAGYSASIGGRDYNETEIPESSLRNIYLPSFKAGVDAGGAGHHECLQRERRRSLHGEPSSAD